MRLFLILFLLIGLAIGASPTTYYPAGTVTGTINANSNNITGINDITFDASGPDIDLNGRKLTDIGNGSDAQETLAFIQIQDGWIPAGSTWYYSSADDPTYKLNITGDKTSKYQPGDRLKLVQTTVKYFIVTAISYSSPNTTITMYGGTDYDLANAAITGPFFSKTKSPQGFPLSPSKWSVVVSDANDASQDPATAHVWYNLGSISITIPIGIWYTQYKVYAYELLAAQTSANIYTTLSTAANSSSDTDYITRMSVNGASATFEVDLTARAFKTLALTAKTTYYLNEKTSKNNSKIGIQGSTQFPTKIEAVCAYL